MWSSKKYRRLTPVHLLLLITGNEVVELVTSNQFNLGETFQKYLAFGIVIYLEIQTYYQIKNGVN
ncbi:hypothetical protein FOL01_1880 [Weissella jogaejeotgali]|uniref:Uncharacterized protein n=1 Tax=Weissella jogaejeotgali TaxID=1631871 RepID=A0A1L6RDU9_9LACO|nr:hypothetical protein [Weissella jogaejeotgali]APS42739.1 hypothetical protein FOL01_1880 [Weissella jogaejeotgali]